MQDAMSNLGSLGAFAGLVLGFGFLIFVHELGHFLVAKWVDIKVTQFAIGFGHSLIAWRKGIGFRRGTTEAEYEKQLAAGASPQSMGETEYRLNWMPLGGYVKMLGQDDMDPTATSDDPRSFNRKPVWARACVISAGVVMNLIFAVILFVIAFMAGVEFPAAVVGDVFPGSPAEKAVALEFADDPGKRGLRSGDRILQINDEQVHDFFDVRINTALAPSDEPIRLMVRRDGHARPLHFEVLPEQGPGEDLLWLGITPSNSLTIGKAVDLADLPAALREAGVKPGMTVTAVEGQPVKRFDHFEQAVTRARGMPVAVRFVDPNPEGKVVDVSIRAHPNLIAEDDTPRHLLGLIPTTRVYKVIPDSKAETIGLRAGDVLMRVDSVDWPGVAKVISTIQAAEDREVFITVWRDGKPVDLTAVVPGHDGKLGFYPTVHLDEAMISGTVPGTPTADMHLTAGSRILAINGEPVTSFADMQRLLSNLAAQLNAQDAANQENGPSPSMILSIRYELAVAGQPKETAEVLLLPDESQPLIQAEWNTRLGDLFDPLEVLVVVGNPVEATKLGLKRTQMYMVQTYLTLARLFQGTVPLEALRGPVGIADSGTQIAYNKGWRWLIFFLGMISVNLVVINFLPIPIVDGGLMVFLIIEKIKGSPVHPRILAAANIVGLTLIGSIFLFTLYHDIARLTLFGQ